MTDIEYIIVGDTEKYNDRLVFPCGESRDKAEEMLRQILTSPTENDKRVMNGHTNFRIKEIPKKYCWWNGNCD